MGILFNTVERISIDTLSILSFPEKYSEKQKRQWKKRDNNGEIHNFYVQVCKYMKKRINFKDRTF
jgi:hypothetical protein